MVLPCAVNPALSLSADGPGTWRIQGRIGCSSVRTVQAAPFFGQEPMPCPAETTHTWCRSAEFFFNCKSTSGSDLRVLTVSCEIKNTPIAAEGYPFVAGAGIATLILVLLSWKIPGTCWRWELRFFIAYFFRNPQRISPAEENTFLAPADGVVTFLGALTESHLGAEMLEDQHLHVGF
ncbi:MAG: hypothetical protein MZU95_08420 [Desulfomicrobium escambiense]|nr:hypothetical protein [Desulfomicrobium escambiense]